jgi:hypothetical protein
MPSVILDHKAWSSWLLLRDSTAGSCWTTTVDTTITILSLARRIERFPFRYEGVIAYMCMMNGWDFLYAWPLFL